MFHEFAKDFFDYVDLKTARKCQTLDEVKQVFRRLVLPEFPKVLRKLCVNFTSFEALRYWTLRKRGRLDLYMPIARELTVSDPQSLMAGTIDRIDRMEDGSLCIVEYKTGRPQIRSVQRELAFYKILLENAQVYKSPINWLAIYNPTENKFYVKKFTDQLVRATRRRIRQFWRALERDEFEAKPGLHCTWCPVKHICPVVGGEQNEGDTEDTHA